MDDTDSDALRAAVRAAENACTLVAVVTLRSWLSALAMVSGASCATREPVCPAPYEVDPTRTRRIVELLAEDPEGRDLVADRNAIGTTCYAPRGEGVISGELMLLDGSAGDARAAARMAHLLFHRRSGSTRTSGDPLAADEVGAHALEARVASRLNARLGKP
jgi:hypothetical protein